MYSTRARKYGAKNEVEGHPTGDDATSDPSPSTNECQASSRCFQRSSWSATRTAGSRRALGLRYDTDDAGSSLHHPLEALFQAQATYRGTARGRFSTTTPRSTFVTVATTISWYPVPTNGSARVGNVANSGLLSRDGQASRQSTRASPRFPSSG